MIPFNLDTNIHFSSLIEDTFCKMPLLIRLRTRVNMCHCVTFKYSDNIKNNVVGAQQKRREKKKNGKIT